MPRTPENFGTHKGPVIPPGGLRAVLTGPGSDGPVQCQTTRVVTLVGTRRDCDLSLNDPDVSKVHCAIVHTGRKLLVCDLCSRNGTLLNGKPVRTAALGPGDRLQIGPVEIRIEFIGAGPNLSAAVGTGVASANDSSEVLVTIGQHSFNLADRAVVIGRRSTCDLVVDTPDVSLAHTLVFAFGGRPVVCDLGSRSGTFLGGQRIELAWLEDGDRLTVGGEVLNVSCRSSLAARSKALAAESRTARADWSVVAAGGVSDRPGRAAQVACGDLAAKSRDLDRRAAELDRRQAELDTLAMLLELQFEHVSQLRRELSRRAAELDQLAQQARERLAQALTHEQAVTAAWAELDRWHAAREARFKALCQQAGLRGQPLFNKADCPGLFQSGDGPAPGMLPV